MEDERAPSPESVATYLVSRPRWVRLGEWVSGRRYCLSRFSDRGRPLIIVAHSFWNAGIAREIASAVEQDWAEIPAQCREAYDEILFKAPGLVVIQLRRANVCGCLGHRHVLVKEAPFAEPHDAFGGEHVGEMDIAYGRIQQWQPLPLTDTALDTKFLEGSRLVEFRAKQFRLRLLSVLLHEINHLVSPQEPETSIRERSLAFYRTALAEYVERTVATLSLTIDRSFFRFG